MRAVAITVGHGSRFQRARVLDALDVATGLHARVLTRAVARRNGVGAGVCTRGDDDGGDDEDGPDAEHRDHATLRRALHVVLHRRWG